MTLTIDLTPEMERKLWDEAAREGMDPKGFILNTLQERLGQNRRATPHLSQEETELLLQINAGLPEETWQRYHALVARRKAETLTAAEHSELIALSNQVEVDNARRIKYLTDLAKLRQTPLESVMKSLGILPSPYV